MNTFTGVGRPFTPFYCVRARARENEPGLGTLAGQDFDLNTT